MKKALKILLVLFMPLITVPAIGQNMKRGIGVGAGVFMPKYIALGEFLDSYNQYYASHLNSPAEFSPVRVSPVFDVHAGFPGFMMSMHFTSYRNKAEASLISGNTRTFELSTRDAGFDVGVGKGEGLFYIHAIGGFGLRSNQLSSYYTYADGTVSYGPERRLNGITESWGWKWYVGGALALPLSGDDDVLQLVIKPQYTWFTSFIDKMDDVSLEYLPKQVGTYFKNPDNYPQHYQDKEGKYYINHLTREFSILLTLRFFMHDE